jgi:hypothetical protein
MEMSNDPLIQLKAAIALAAQERDKKDQKSRDDQAAKEKRRDQARDVWAERKKELPTIVDSINRMLRDHGYEGLTIGVFDSKHSDGNLEQYPFSSPWAPAEFRIELG